MMRDLALLMPLALALAITVVVTAWHRRLPPQVATRFVSAGLVVVALVAVPTSAVLTMAFLAHMPIIGSGFRWCSQVFGLHGAISPWVGIPSLTLFVGGIVRCGLLLRQHRRLGRLVLADSDTIHIVESRKSFAVTLPGDRRSIYVSRPLWDLLDDAERSVVIEHERAHLRHRHHRYVIRAEVAAALVPPLRALTRRVTYSIERWADEVTARAVGDRLLVAATLGKVALHSSGHEPLTAGFAGLGVASRMRALLDPPRPTLGRGRVMGLLGTLVFAGGLGVVQLHHLEYFLGVLCPH